jgi:hypothetical protein
MAKKAVPTNPALYARAKAKVKRRVKKWPSAYSSAQLVQEYKRMGGGYRTVKNGSKKQTKKRSR